MTVEGQESPSALSEPVPRFSWQYLTHARNVTQESYRLVVASSEEMARNGVGDLWDSRVVGDSRMLQIPYGGDSLKSRQIAYWKVYATLRSGKKGRLSVAESNVQRFETSLLREGDWQKEAQWIGRAFDDDVTEGSTRIAARYLRSEFEVTGTVTRARVYLSGLGQYSLYVNGVEVAAEEWLKPTLSDYDKRVYFNSYDITPYLKEGTNAIGVILVGGRYTAMRRQEGIKDGPRNMVHYGLPMLKLQAELQQENGTRQYICSGSGRWRITNSGPVRTANEFDGETYHARMELGAWSEAGYDDSRWFPAEPMPGPKGGMQPQPNPNIKVQERLKAVSLFKKGDAWMVDMGQNMVGNLRLRAHGLQKGDTVVMRFAEILTADSLLGVANLRKSENTDRYIADGPEMDWHPQFVYHGFRFVEVKGLRQEPKLSDFEGLVFYDAMPETGSFESSNEVMNAVYNNACWTIRGNYRGMPTDCPQRDERMGWTGDRTIGAYGESYIFNNSLLYAKWLTDAEDSQLESGSVPDVIPAYWRFYSNSMTWPGAYITVADMLYTRFGDKRPIERHYASMKRWLDFMSDNYMKEDILIKDTYGDWCMPPENTLYLRVKDTNRITKAPAISTPYYCHLAAKMARFADMLGQTEDAARYTAQIQRTTDAYNRKYFDSQTARYSNNTVTANLLPLAFGMVPAGREKEVLANVVDRTLNDFGGHVSSGVIGVQFLMRTLTAFGRSDLAYHIATDDTYPSWGYMWRQGATTIWEEWNGATANPAMNSGNHVMLLGDLVTWEYECLGGISALEPGYSRIRLKPVLPEGLDRVNCTYQSVSGAIVSCWKRSGDSFEWKITIPANTTAEVSLPMANGYETQVLGSGTYRLKSKVR